MKKTMRAIFVITFVFLLAACGRPDEGPPELAVRVASEALADVLEKITNEDELGHVHAFDYVLNRNAELKLSPEDGFESIEEQWCIEYSIATLLESEGNAAPSIIFLTSRNDDGSWTAEIPNIYGFYANRDEDYARRWESCLLN